MISTRWLRPLARFLRALEGIEAHLGALVELERRSQAPKGVFYSGYPDFQRDGSSFGVTTDDILVYEQDRKARYQAVTGKILLPGDEVPEDFS